MNLDIPRSCLITGGCGFIGSNIASHFINLGSKITIIDNLARNGSANNLTWLKNHNTEINFINGDIRDIRILNETFTKHGPFDFICHFAGQVAMTTSLENPLSDFECNALGTLNLLESIRNLSNESYFAYSSTNKVYGNLEYLEHKETKSRYITPSNPNGFDESTPLDFASPYGCSKGAADQYTRDWHRNFGTRTTVFRLSSIYGKRQFSTYDQGWIGWFCQMAKQQFQHQLKHKKIQPFTISGNGKQVRDALHSEDLVKLYHLAYHHRNNIAGEVFNIGGGIANSISLLELFLLLEKFNNQGSRLHYNKLPPRKSDQRVFISNNDKVSKILGWKPCISVEEGIRKIISQLNQNH